MRHQPLRLLPVAFMLALYGVACDAPLEDEGSVDETTPSTDSETAESAAVTNPEAFHAVYRFQGSFDPTTGFTFEPAVLETSEFRTAEQAMWCGMTIVADGTAGSGPVDTVEVVGEPGTLNTYEDCFPGGVYPSLTFANGGALCQDVTVRSFFDTESLQNVHAVIDDLSDLAYIAYNVPPITGAPSPGGDNLPNISRGLWSYGNLGPAGSGTNASTEQWIFNYPQEQSFRFNGRVIAAFTEVCAPGNTTDDDCDGRVNEGCREYTLSAVCRDNTDCQSVNCDPATLRCIDTTCGDGLLNGTETDLDCGGLCSAKCVNGDTCSVNGDCLSNVCRTGTCAAFRAPLAGEVVVTEVMANPQGDDALFEWFELTNVSSSTLDLTGCVLTDALVDNHPIATTLSIPAGGRIVIGANANPTTNGGLNVAYAYGTTYQLSNSGDEVRLSCGGTLIDAYVVPTSQLGYASQVSTGVETATANDVSSNTCRATTSYGTSGDFGTPGAANTACSLSNVNCRVTRPTSSLSAVTPSSVLSEAIVNVPGLTDLTNRFNASAQLQVQGAFVPTGTDASTFADVNWSNATGVGGASSSPAPFAGSDLYRLTASLTAPSGTTGNIVYRVRGSGTAPWTLCDADAQGSFNGYTVGSLPLITLVAAAPTPVAGDFIVSEILIDGNIGGSQESNEFIEFRNISERTLDLNGCTVGDLSSNALISTATQVPPGGYFVIQDTGGTFTAPAPGIVSVLTLANGSDTVFMSCGADIVRLTYTSSGSPGVSLVLPPTNQASVQPFSQFCNLSDVSAGNVLGNVSGNIDYGTPGRDNPACAALSPISACYLNAGSSTTLPNTFSAITGVSQTITARVEIPGLTNNSNSNNTDVRVVGEVGFGPNDTDPSTDESAYVWTSTTPTAAFSTTTGEDQYQAAVSVATAGTYALVARFSQDGGDTWTYCDTRDEATGGNVFSLALADVLSISAAPTIVGCNIGSGGSPKPLGSVATGIILNVNSTLSSTATAALIEAQVGVAHSSSALGLEASYGFVATNAGSDFGPGVLFFGQDVTAPDFSTGSAVFLGRVRLAGTSAWTYCSAVPSPSSPTLAGAVPLTQALTPFDLGTVTHQTPAATSVLQGGTLSLSARAFIEGLTNRTAGAEQSSTVTVRHSFEPSANAANFDGVPTFDTGYSAANVDVEYDIAVPTSSLAAGTYNSQWQVCVAPGVCATSAVETITLTVSPVWINEVFYQQTTTSEGVEVAGIVGTDLTGYTLSYRSSGGLGSNNLSLTGTLTSTIAGVGLRFFNQNGLGNSGGQLALIAPDGTVVDHITWGPDNVTGNPTFGSGTSVGVPVGVTSTTTSNSIGRTGSGCAKADFGTWVRQTTLSSAAINPGQTFTCPPPVLPGVDGCYFDGGGFVSNGRPGGQATGLAGVEYGPATLSATADPLLEVEYQLALSGTFNTEPAAGWIDATFDSQSGAAHSFAMAVTYPDTLPTTYGWLVRARYAGGPWRYCGSGRTLQGGDPVYASDIFTTVSPNHFLVGTPTQEAPSTTSAVQGTAVTYSVLATVTDLTQRSPLPETSSLVTVQHSIYPSAGSPTVWNNGTFDSAWPASNATTRYTISVPTGSLAVGTYTSVWRVCYNSNCTSSGTRSLTVTAPASITPFINEIGYGGSSGETVEIGGPAGGSAVGLRLAYYSAGGGAGGTATVGAGVNFPAGTGITFISVPLSGMSDTAGQVVLVAASPATTVLDHLSWGTITSNPTSGIGNGSARTATGVTANTATTSIGRTGTGCSRATFGTFAAFGTRTLGAVNASQTISGCP